MSDMINRQDAIDALIKMLSDCFYADEEVLDAVKTTLNELPPAQPEPQERRGKWVDENGNAVKVIGGIPQGWSMCSECGEWLTASDEYPCIGKFCPNCGQRMEVDNE